MKKLSLIVLSLIALTSAHAQVSTISGHIKSTKITEVILCTIEDGVREPYAKTKLDKDGYFAFTFKPSYEGFYVVEEDAKYGNKIPVYLKKGDNAEFVMENNDLTFSKNSTKENRVLGEWLTLSKSVRTKSIHFYLVRSTFEDFFPEFEKLLPVANAFASSIKTKNERFNELMRDVVKFELDYYALNFIRSPRSKHPNENEYIPYYANIIVKNKFPNDNILKMPQGAFILSHYAEYKVMEFNDIEGKLKKLSSDAQKGTYLSENMMRGIKTYPDFTNFTEKYGQYFVTTRQKRILEDLRTKLYDAKIGMPAENFTYPDINDKMVSLSDFKGKVVLIDVWATWCGPCKKEIPFLIKLEDELHDNKNIAFIGITVDDPKDKQKWINMVTEKNLGGVQLFAGRSSKISKDYKITSIPRFLIFDKKGNIYSIDAPRPSDPELKKILIKLAAE